MNDSYRSGKLISDRDREIYETTNYVVLMAAISLLGTVANVMNIVVFSKQGFHNTMNISFLGLAIADLCGLVTLIWFSVCVNPMFISSEVPMAPKEIQYLTGGLPHTCFARITGWITVFVTAERCLCIMIPLKIKRVITPRRTTTTVCIIYATNIISYFPEYGMTYIDWKFYPQKNQTLLGLVFISNSKNLEGLVFYLYSILGSASFAGVIIFTVLLVVQLKQKSKWRMKANADKSQSESISNREQKTVTMVVTIATVLIVCYTPGVAVSMVSVFVPEFSMSGQFVNSFFVLWSYVFIFEAVNSSVNIFFYYKMSSKYRDTFNQVFCIQKTVARDRKLIQDEQAYK